jgi:hypothetical protein
MGIATRLAASKLASGGTVSVRAAALAKGVQGAMWMTKLRMAALVLAAAVAMAGGGGVYLCGAGEGEEGSGQTAVPVPPASAGKDAIKDVAQSSPRNSDAELIRKVYSVADLLVYVDDATTGHRLADPNVLNRLIERIVEIAPETWSDVNGYATIQYYPLGLAFVILQTAANHEKIIDQLESMRQEGLEIEIENRFLVLPPAKAQLFLKSADFLATETGRALPQVAFLKEQQCLGWLRQFQGDPACKIDQMPKASILDGQKVDLVVGDEVSIGTLLIDGQGNAQEEKVLCGLRSNVLPIVSADRQFVRMRLAWQKTDLERPSKLQTNVRRLAFETTVVIPSGGTAVWYLGNNEAKQGMFVMVTTSVITNAGAKEARSPEARGLGHRLPRIPR